MGDCIKLEYGIHWRWYANGAVLTDIVQDWLFDTGITQFKLIELPYDYLGEYWGWDWNIIMYIEFQNEKDMITFRLRWL